MKDVFSSFLIILNIVLYMGVLPVCMSVYVICSSTCTGQKMASYPVGLGVTDGHEPSCRHWKLSPDLENQSCSSETTLPPVQDMFSSDHFG